MASKKLLVLLSLFILPLAPLHAEELLKGANGKSAITLDQKGSDSAQLTINLPGLSVMNVFDVPDPRRLVIDLKGIKGGKDQQLTPQNTSLVKKIRVGIHPDKYRLVMDLTSPDVPNYSFKEEKGIFRLTLVAGKKVAANIKPTPTPTPVPTVVGDVKEPVKIEAPKVEQPKVETKPTATPVEKTAEILDAEQPVAHVSPIKAPSEQAPIAKQNLAVATEPAKEPEAIKGLEEIPANENDQQLSSIKFVTDKDSGLPAVRLGLLIRPKFNLTRASDRSYLLTIPDSSFKWSHLTLPHFPPYNFKGFTLVMAEQKGKNVEVTVGVDRSAKLTAFAKDNDIVLTVTQ